MLNDAEYREAQEKYGRDGFVAKMGGEAIRDLLAAEDLNAVLLISKKNCAKQSRMQARMKLAKRLKDHRKLYDIIEQAGLDGDGCVPVIPPELRPLVPLDGGRFATSDLNDLISSCDQP